MGIRARQILIALLLMAFAGQTWLVYVDPAGREHRLTPQAAEGQTLWRENNCQSCHQLFGFGGFLGPDLTNAIDDLSPERLDSVLTLGAGQMPAFSLTPAERTALAVYLREIDETGVSQLVMGELVSADELLGQIVEAEGELPADAARGWEHVRNQSCIGCHLPYVESLHRAADLTTMAETTDPLRIVEILHDGIPGKAMPRLMLAPEDSRDVIAFLRWMGSRGSEIRGRFAQLTTDGELQLSKIPWFEYQ